ncbi:DgyrCDS14500 [Dimorphilus gyrociliatus]|uniref:DgyrCDS14500 n=1 Tax=Dimorphilus gyrociliatus TaxID=2664684 RepID=A0A7I8WDT1_9ANNE|nr:DgyrCDS14500 [Dimorphilus gyrociliatus]
MDSITIIKLLAISSIINLKVKISIGFKENCFTLELFEKVLINHKIEELESTYEECRSKCFEMENCKSINYDFPDGKCSINSGDSLSYPNDLIVQSNSKYVGPSHKYCKEFTNPVYCSYSSEKIAGSSNTYETRCNERGGCWKNSKCFYGDTYIPGFIKYNKIPSTVDQLALYTFISLNDCGTACLSNSECKYFVYNFDQEKCEMSKSYQAPSGLVTTTQMTYYKLATSSATCFNRACDELEEHLAVDATACKDICNAESCKTFTYLVNDAVNHCTTHTTELCEATPINTQDIVGYSCILQPIFNDFTTINDQKTIDITDSDIDTCVTITTEKQFSLRIPWPTVGTNSTDFEIRIKGTNLKQCINPINSLLNSGVFAYVPHDLQVNPEFFGIFNTCHVTTGDDTYCNYICSCNSQHCQAVYIKGFGLTDENMQICEYEIHRL